MYTSSVSVCLSTMFIRKRFSVRKIVTTRPVCPPKLCLNPKKIPGEERVQLNNSDYLRRVMSGSLKN